MNNEELENEEVETEAVETDVVDTASEETAAKAPASTKKFKILLVIDILLIVGGIVVSKTVSSSAKEYALKSGKQQVRLYTDKGAEIKGQQWQAVDQNGMAWSLVYKTLSGAKTEAAFDANAKGIFENKEGRMEQASYVFQSAGYPEAAIKMISDKAGLADKFVVKNEGGVKEIACGPSCTVTFNFEKGKLKKVDYEALKKYNISEYVKMVAPDPFQEDFVVVDEAPAADDASKTEPTEDAK